MVGLSKLCHPGPRRFSCSMMKFTLRSFPIDRVNVNAKANVLQRAPWICRCVDMSLIKPRPSSNVSSWMLPQNTVH
ncbi:uncharacterized protein MYCGRDRAFT_105740 [Zymoseptoria tritici IPO323]|uniref:Uncharacterized protein n=1 Tax=Zymoseptoria tritici (strain CBS 115943 / IPO323) TaxID=336722 RepID=F9XJ95_ZYMTI|nr:uncharacterized protein MYCGRDRAFT_105740 [Zymoseptoria tritici IPO323]EGP84643.1 hypothetical protein MYCGRDRAFT_105740 [Zymoseptoria tritici IPO323]